ncbi:hypothetical protein BJ138DRAFT_1103992 [Hygrophoropsis aurantiaca]|uniref:Uncharacterized protein n=1 Tax=Hygrophoropsis aurantiaca TaxID=72124 RepID=A0ACB8A494_9AGAM|nr:hypothetical protein BJ138DRAFT_1103992 [Hygrophoropsis aurantiaca]
MDLGLCFYLDTAGQQLHLNLYSGTSRGIIYQGPNAAGEQRRLRKWEWGRVTLELKPEKGAAEDPKHTVQNSVHSVGTMIHPICSWIFDTDFGQHWQQHPFHSSAVPNKQQHTATIRGPTRMRNKFPIYSMTSPRDADAEEGAHPRGSLSFPLSAPCAREMWMWVWKRWRRGSGLVARLTRKVEFRASMAALLGCRRRCWRAARALPPAAGYTKEFCVHVKARHKNLTSIRIVQYIWTKEERLQRQVLFPRLKFGFFLHVLYESFFKLLIPNIYGPGDDPTNPPYDYMNPEYPLKPLQCLWLTCPGKRVYMDDSECWSEQGEMSDAFKHVGPLGRSFVDGAPPSDSLKTVICDLKSSSQFIPTPATPVIDPTFGSCNWRQHLVFPCAFITTLVKRAAGITAYVFQSTPTLKISLYFPFSPVPMAMSTSTFCGDGDPAKSSAFYWIQCQCSISLFNLAVENRLVPSVR